MFDDTLKVFKELNKRDFRILTGIEIEMKNYEWVPVPELQRYVGLPTEKLNFHLERLRRKKMVVGTLDPYEGYKIYFEAYDALALHTYVQRKTIAAVGSEIGVGKESVVVEVLKEPEIEIAEPEVFILKLHREGRTSFKQVKRTREHLVGKEHFSWIYAARLASKREFTIMSKLYPDISVPKPIDQNRHTLVMEVAKGSELSKTKVLDPEWYLDEILNQIRLVYSKGIIHNDLSEYNIFVSDEGVQLIDWPQYITKDHPHAEELLRRDIENVLNHFSKKYMVHRDADEILRDILENTTFEDAVTGDPDVVDLMTAEDLAEAETMTDDDFEEGVFAEDFDDFTVQY
ncbi:serine/threonine protein kinase [Methanimicrococcus sp. OttesenSCG-928-J09]|nr:serine/threonine protein kinase [Methanimicrococcus sp. OttesenSCG-928-J09]